MNSYFWGWHWVDWRVATATNAWTPDFKASFEAATALKTRFIAGQLILLLSAVIFFFFYWLMGHWLRFIWLWSAWKSYLSGKNEQVTRVEFGTLLITWFLLCYYCLRFFISKLTQIQNWDLCWFWWFWLGYILVLRFFCWRIDWNFLIESLLVLLLDILVDDLTQIDNFIFSELIGQNYHFLNFDHLLTLFSFRKVCWR